MFPAKTLVLDTFSLPGRPINAASDLPLAKAIVAAMRRDGIFQIAMDAAQQRAADDMYAAMRRFFALPMDVKERCVDPRSFAGYTASGEEVTNGIRDYSEIFTVVKDLPLDDWRVKADWPCHGPCPWPDDGGDLARAANAYFKAYGVAGEKVLALLELGLGVPKGSFTSLTRDGWHHSRLLR